MRGERKKRYKKVSGELKTMAYTKTRRIDYKGRIFVGMEYSGKEFDVYMVKGRGIILGLKNSIKQEVFSELGLELSDIFPKFYERTVDSQGRVNLGKRILDIAGISPERAVTRLRRDLVFVTLSK